MLFVCVRPCTRGLVVHRWAGMIMAMSNSAATLCGILAPYFTNTVAHSLKDPSVLRDQWKVVFLVAAVVHVVGAGFFLVFGKGSEQAWAREGFSVTKASSGFGEDAARSLRNSLNGE